jgi:hypothetical protein
MDRELASGSSVLCPLDYWPAGVIHKNEKCKGAEGKRSFEFFYFPETPPETTNAIASELSILTGVTRPEGKINTEPAKLYDCGK